MKRKILILILSLFILAPLVLAQDTTIGDVEVQFCNNDKQTKNLSMVLEGGMEDEICMDFSNYSNSDVTLKYGFVDGTIAIGDTPKKACKNEGEGEEFAQYVTQDTDTITILAGETVRQKAKIKYPAGFSGMINGCMTYSIVGDESNLGNEDNMFSILVRRAKFIDVLIGGELKRKIQFSNNDAVSYSFNSKTNEFIINISLTNQGNIDENLSITGIVNNAFGYEKAISMENIKIASDSTQNIEIIVDNIPRYKLSYDADLTLIGSPDFKFNAASLPDEMKGPITMHLSLNLFQFPWTILIYILGGIVIIILICYLVKHLKFQK